MELAELDYDRDMLPPEDLLDTDHPANDNYIRKLKSTQQAIVSHSRTMRPRHVNIIKRIHTGEPHKDIAAAFNLTTVTISTIKRSPKGAKLLALLAHYGHAVEGPNEAQRRNMLWRIAHTNEEDAPKTSLTAIAELNRMTIADYDRTQKNPSQAPLIVINQAVLPKGVLDG